MGGFVSKVCSVAAQVAADVKKAAEALWASITRAARSVPSFFSALFRAAASAAASAYAAMKRAAAAAARFLPKEAKTAILVVAVAAVLGIAIWCCMPAGAMMVAPGGGGLLILRHAFEAFAALYFMVLRAAGPEAAVVAATLAFAVRVMMMATPLWASVI